MKVDQIIATIELDRNRALDMELPVFLPMCDLADRVLEVLQNQFPAEFETVGEIRMTVGEHVLDSSSNLAAEGLWDGSVLGIVRR